MREKVPRRWLKWLLVGVGLWLVLPVVAGFVARMPMVRAYAGAEASRALKRELGLVASIADVDVDPERLAVVARGIQLDHPVHGRFADAAVLRIRPSWWALARGSIDLSSITIEDATLFLKVRDGRIVNLPGVKTSADADADLDLPFDRVRVKRSRVVVDAAPVANGELGPIDIDLDASADDLVVANLLARGGFVNHRTGREVLTHLQLSGDVTRDSIDVELLHVKSQTVELALRDGTISLPDAKEVDGDIEVELDLARAAQWPHGLTLPHVEGKVNATASLSHAGGRLRGDARVKLTGGVIKWYRLGDEVSLSAQFDEEHVQFDGVARVDTGEVGFGGSVGLGEGHPTALDVDIRELSFARLMGVLDVSQNAIVDWNLNGKWALKGTLDPLKLVGPMSMPTRDFRVTRDAYHQSPARPIIAVQRAQLDGTVHIDDRAFHLRDVDIKLPGSKLYADVRLGFDNDLTVRARGIDWNLADSSPLLQFALGGRGSFEMQMGGTFGDPTLTGTASIAGFSFHTFPFGDLETDFELDPDLMGVQFTRMQATKKHSAYALKGAFLDFRNDAFRAGGDVEIASMTLGDFYDVFHYTGDERYEPYQGRVEGSARIDYTMDYPGDGENGTMVARIDVDVPEAELTGYAFDRGHFAGDWRWLDHEKGYRGGELTIDRFSLRKGEGTVNVSGKMGLEGALDLVAVGDRIAIKDTEGIRDRLAGLSGTYSVTARVGGTAAVPRADIDLVGTGLSFGGETLGDGRAYVRLTDKDDPWIREALNWDRTAPPADARCGHARLGLAHGRWPEDPPLRTVDGPQPALEKPMAWVVCGSALDGQLAVDLAVGRTDVYPLRGLFELNDLRFGKLLPRSRQQPPMSGSITGRLELDDGAMLEPRTLGGRMDLTKLRAGQFDVELVNSGPVAVRFGRGSFDVESADFIGPSSQLYIRGGGSMRDGLALSVNGNVDLGLLSTLSQTVTDAAGTVDLQFKITGQADHPAVYGHAGLHGGALRLASFAEPVSDVNGRVTFSAHRVLLEGFSARVAGGRLSWSGAAALHGRSIGSYQIDLDARGMALSPRDGIDLKLGGLAQLAWKDGDRLPLLRGTLRIDDFMYTRPIKMGRDLQDIYKAQRTDIDNYDPDADLLALDLKVVQSKDFVVQNNLIEAKLRIEDGKRPFKLVGTDQRYGVLGNMSLHGGTVRFRDAEFDLRQGDISFDDETRIDPTFDLRAVTDVRRTTDQTNWHIGIHAWGSRDSFQFDLSSDPYLSQDDIALLLTVGMTHSELAQLETGELTSTAALEALASVTGVEREVHRALPEIDDFHIASSYSETSNRTEPQVFIGKRIADRVRLSASTGIAESRDFSTGVELQISDETSVEAVYNNQNSTSTSHLGDVGVDLKWRLEFD